MLPVMPIEPTNPMPSRSSGTNAIATPALFNLHRRLADDLARLAVDRGIDDGRAGGSRMQARDASEQLLLAGAGDARHAEDLTAHSGEGDVVERTTPSASKTR